MTPGGARVIVAGGGAAGLMASISAAQAGAKVTLLEPNAKVGRKLYITGKGRCNLTNACELSQFMAAVNRNSRFLYSALNRFGPQDAMDFFQDLGVPLKTERGRRVFPVSDRAADVVDALFREIRRQGVDLQQDRATGLILRTGRLTGVRTEANGDMACKALILATGGASYPGTGSTGEGYALAKQGGHTIVPIRGSLVPLESPDPACPQLQGLSLRNVALRFANGGGKTLWHEQGELLFTHFGLSGPLILTASAHADFSKGPCTAHIDLKPALDEAALDARLLRDFGEKANQSAVNALRGLMPASLVPVAAERAGLPLDKKVRDIRREERRAILNVLKDFSFTVTGPRPIEEAIVTAGGVSVREVDPSTMASKLTPGLYIAGELLDVDADTGGYNLQIAWATGRAAGLAAAARDA